MKPDNIKYMQPPPGCDGLVPVHQMHREMRLKDHLTYLNGVSDTAGWICLSSELMREIVNNYRSIEEWGDRRRYENDRLKESVERYAKKLKELKRGKP